MFVITKRVAPPSPVTLAETVHKAESTFAKEFNEFAATDLKARVPSAVSVTLTTLVAPLPTPKA